MATLVKTDAGTWKAIIRKQGWPITSKTFRTKRDATDWARSTEDEMVRGVYISRAGAERLTVKEALQRYLKEVTQPRSQARSAARRSPPSTWRALSVSTRCRRSQATSSLPIAITASLPESQTTPRQSARQLTDEQPWIAYRKQQNSFY